MRFISVLLGGMLALGACQPLPGGSPAVPAVKAVTATIQAGIRLGGPFAVQDGPKTAASVAAVTFELLDATADTVRESKTQPTSDGLTCTFADVPDGHYKVRVTALDGDGASITKGPTMPTSDVITVSGGVVAYPFGQPGVTLAIPLLDGTGEQVHNEVVIAGYTGAAIVPAYYRYRLVRTDVTPNVVTTFDHASGTIHFDQVPDGTYHMYVEAFDDQSRSITQGGEQASANTVTVDGSSTPTVTYSSGAKFSPSLTLFRWPTLTGVSPAWAPVGTTPTLTVTGTDFEPGATVTIGGATATVTANAGTQLTATVPEGLLSGVHDVMVTNPGGGTVTAAGTFALATMTATAIAPVSGHRHLPTTMTITGTYFAPGVTVTIGGTSATSVTIGGDGTQLTVVVPTMLTAGAKDVVVTNPGSVSVTFTGAFDVTVLTPTVTTVSPASGDRSLSHTLTIAGTDFATGATVMVGDTAATVTGLTATEITATLPAGLPPGTRDVVVTNPGGGTVTKAGAFTLTGATINATVTFQGGQPHMGTPAGGSGW